MKLTLVVVFSIIAASLAVPVDPQIPSVIAKDVTATTKDAAHPNGEHIPVAVVYEKTGVDESSGKPLSRQKRFILHKLLLAKAAVGLGALSYLNSVRFVNIRSNYSVTPGGGNFYYRKTYTPFVSTVSASSAGSVVATAPVAVAPEPIPVPAPVAVNTVQSPGYFYYQKSFTPWNVNISSGPAVGTASLSSTSTLTTT